VSGRFAFRFTAAPASVALGLVTDGWLHRRAYPHQMQAVRIRRVHQLSLEEERKVTDIYSESPTVATPVTTVNTAAAAPTAVATETKALIAVATTPIAAPADTELDKIGQRLVASHARAERGDHEWVEGVLEMAAALAEGRARFKSDVEFGDWLARHGHNFLGKNDRAALISLGRDIPAARTVLKETKSRSFQLIWIEARDRFPNARKPTSHRVKPTHKSSAADEIAERQLRNVEQLADFMPPAAKLTEHNVERELDPDRNYRAAGRARRPRSLAQQHEIVDRVLFLIQQYVSNDDLEIPPLGLNERQEAVRSIDNSIEALGAFRNRLLFGPTPAEIAETQIRDDDDFMPLEIEASYPEMPEFLCRAPRAAVGTPS
jgi:hypothetical protein